MEERPANESLALAQALGRVPSGLFILTVRHGGRDTGALVSWVQQASFEPPRLTVALRHDRLAAAWVAESGRFALNQIAAGHKRLLRHFARGFGPEEAAFEGLELGPESRGGPVLAEALAYLDAQVDGQMEAGDHRIFLARLVGGGMIDPAGEPMVHVRHNGFHY